jgi:hypothetical protein
VHYLLGLPGFASKLQLPTFMKGFVHDAAAWEPSAGAPLLNLQGLCECHGDTRPRFCASPSSVAQLVATETAARLCYSSLVRSGHSALRSRAPGPPSFASIQITPACSSAP